MRKNNYLLLILSLAILPFLSGCAKDKPEDPLLLPPNFEVVPSENGSSQISPEKEDAQTKELRDLLLKDK